MTEKHYFVATTLYTVDGDKTTDVARAMFGDARAGNFDDAIKIVQEHILHVLPIGLTFRMESPSPISAGQAYWVQVNKESDDG
jgi:hypothetical protein